MVFGDPASSTITASGAGNPFLAISNTPYELSDFRTDIENLA
jgi:hypothetical protein